MELQADSQPQVRQISATMSINEVKKMLKRLNFYDSQWNAEGTGFKNQFELLEIDIDKVIVDKACHLMWQNNGSDSLMTLNDSDWWIKTLNRKTFAGFSNWRFPTLEELMTLVTPLKNHSHLHIDPIFCDVQKYIWTADKVRGEPWTWVVDFVNGNCFGNHFSNLYHVRAVRLTQ